MQRKIYVLLLLSHLAYTCLAQRSYNYYDWNIGLQYYPVKHEMPKGIKEVRYTELRKGKKLKSSKEFNENGQLVKFYPVEDPKQKRGTLNVVYDAYQHSIQVTMTRKNKVEFAYQYERLPNGKPLVEKYIKSGKIRSKYTYTYNADGNLVEQKRYTKGGAKLKNSITFEYQDKNNKSKTTFYNHKGKVKKVWLYDCKEEGELQTAKKNEKGVCLKKDISGNVLTEVYEKYDQKGRVGKTVLKYNLADT